MSTAMIIDADPLGRNQLRVAMQRAGFDVRSSVSPLTAEEPVPLASYDVVAIDGSTRPEEAIATLARLRSRGWKGTALYVAERVSDPQLDELTRLLGVRAVFLKPLSFAELSARLPRLLGVSEGAAPGRDLDVAKGWEGALEKVRQEAAARLPDDMQRLRVLAERAEAHQPGALEELHRLAHTLHGTAGTYKFVVVSEVAAAVEVIAEACGAGHEIGRAHV